jgi:hypothetical protein
VSSGVPAACTLRRLKRTAFELIIAISHLAACPEWPPASTGQAVLAAQRAKAPLNVFSELTLEEYNAGAAEAMQLQGPHSMLLQHLAAKGSTGNSLLRHTTVMYCSSCRQWGSEQQQCRPAFFHGSVSYCNMPKLTSAQPAV